jgi:hypothetical protein
MYSQLLLLSVLCGEQRVTLIRSETEEALVRGEGFEPFRSEHIAVRFRISNPYGTGAFGRDVAPLSPAPLTWLGDPRITIAMMTCTDLMVAEKLT